MIADILKKCTLCPNTDHTMCTSAIVPFKSTLNFKTLALEIIHYAEYAEVTTAYSVLRLTRTAFHYSPRPKNGRCVLQSTVIL